MAIIHHFLLGRDIANSFLSASEARFVCLFDLYLNFERKPLLLVQTPPKPHFIDLHPNWNRKSMFSVQTLPKPDLL